MKIAYIAKHGQVNSNDDEGAITYALRKLGHEVTCYDERHNVGIVDTCNFCLFHHWSDFKAMRALCSAGVPLVFWNFDLVEWPNDPTLKGRDDKRKKWMHEVMNMVCVGFCTDGDWALKHPDKLVWLPQGFDERQAPVRSTSRHIPILFTGISKGGGIQRESFVEEMTAKYGGNFVHYKKGLHGQELAWVISQAKVVVAPDSPITDRYWSNRVYNVTGLSGFLFHPYTRGLENQYGNAIEYYKTRDQLHRLIKWALNLRDIATTRSGEAAMERTLEMHTYRHRCEKLVRTVKERLGL